MSKTNDEVTYKIKATPPGPGRVDVTAYNTRTRQYLVDLHDRYGDTFVMDMTNVTRPSEEGKTAPVVFVRGATEVRRVLQDTTFVKTRGPGYTAGAGSYTSNLVMPILSGTMFNNIQVQSAHPERIASRKFFTAGPLFASGYANACDRCLDDWAERDVKFNVLHASKDLAVSMLLTCCVGVGASAIIEPPIRAAFERAGRHFEEAYGDVKHSMSLCADDEAVMLELQALGQVAVRQWKSYHAARPGLLADAAEKHSLFALLHSSKASDRDMGDTLINSIIAAGEAIAIGVAQTLHQLTRNPGLLERATTEVHELLSREGESFVHSVATGALPFVEQCLLEAMRVAAPATIVTRANTETVSIGGFTFAPNTGFAVCIPAAHFNECAFSDAQAFKPERGSALNYTVMDRQRPFLAFSAGYRGCPGKHVAMVSMRVALAKILLKFALAPSTHCAPLGKSAFPKFVDWHVA